MTNTVQECSQSIGPTLSGTETYGLLTLESLSGSILSLGDSLVRTLATQVLGAGLAGERSGLWGEYIRIVRCLRPRFVLVENVAALLVRGFETVIGDLANSGYDAEWDSLRAGYFGAPHRRERVFLLAYTNESNGQAGLGAIAQWPRPLFAGCDCARFPVWLQAADCFIGVDDGVSAKVYQAEVGGLGNAVVPQVAQWIGERILEASL